MLNLKIICKIWHLAVTVYSSDYFLNTYYFIKCTIIFYFHNSPYDHTVYTVSFFIFPSSSIFSHIYLVVFLWCQRGREWESVCMNERICVHESLFILLPFWGRESLWSSFAFWGRESVWIWEIKAKIVREREGRKVNSERMF